ncbi:cinnamoyl-CoA reductase CAD2 isoform X2 [Cannabis sativa]|uniref:cinnamoyl-CoA reductase CAD2 isoform X2 n=1 Tax=Cannabis sativa TaxID=3483 RepID=UPI0011DFB2F1|nr:cinnamoyl-CoA reductase CAD2 isoform X2 [Cannabis sativa]
MSGEGKVVCVTGASGFIASWLVKLLLQRGYTVKASVRDLSDAKKTEHLISLDGAKERLQLFKANLLEEGSFDSVVDHCECVFHTASPLTFTVNDPQLWYMLSKTLAEEGAWKFAKENGIDLVSLNPGFVIGPFLQPTLNFTMEMILNIINNEENFPNMMYDFSDVRDIAMAHILAFEKNSANGRYCLVANYMHISHTLQIIQQLYPTLTIPNKCESYPLVEGPKTSKVKALSLGVKFTPLEVTLRDTIQSFIEKGYLKI